MKIVVAIKQVPERGAPVRVDASGLRIDERGLQFAMNEPDAYALERALTEPAAQLADFRRLREVLGTPETLDRCAQFALRLAGR